MSHKYPLIIYATGYPLHGDAARVYLNGFYDVITVGHSLWNDGLQEIDRHLVDRPAAVMVDHTFPHDLAIVASQIKAALPNCGLIYVDANPNIFRVLRCLEQGYVAYLYLGDHLADKLKLVIDMARRGERFLSPTVLDLYERYTLYRGLFNSLSDALMATFKMMGEGFSPQEIIARTGARPQNIYRRQYRLRRHFGVESNDELLGVIQGMFEDSRAAPKLSSVVRTLELSK